MSKLNIAQKRNKGYDDDDNFFYNLIEEKITTLSYFFILIDIVVDGKTPLRPLVVNYRQLKCTLQTKPKRNASEA